MGKNTIHVNVISTSEIKHQPTEKVTVTGLDAKIMSRILDTMRWKKSVFPVVTPTPLRRSYLEKSRTFADYLVTEKPEGIDALLYHGKEGLVWCGTDYAVHHLHLEGLEELETDDECMIAHAVWEKKERTFIVTDVAYLFGESCSFVGFKQRIDNFQKHWLDRINWKDSDLFKIKVNKYTKIRDYTLSTQTHEGQTYQYPPTSTLLLMNEMSHYSCGRNDSIWEWTPPTNVFIRMRMRWIQHGDVYQFSLWCMSPEGDREIKYADLPNASTKKKPGFPNDSIVITVYDNNIKICLPANLGVAMGGWKVIQLERNITKPDQIKDVLSKVRTLGENVQFDEIKTTLMQSKEDVEMYDLIDVE